MNQIPHSERYEKSALSSLMQEGFHLEGAETLTPDVFYSPTRRRMFELIAEQASTGFDLTRFIEECITNGILDKLGGPASITECYTFAPTSTHFQDHVKALLALQARRKAIKAARELIEAAENITDDEAFLIAAGAPMNEVIETATATHQGRSKKEILKIVMTRFEERVKGGQETRGWETSFPKYNETLRGLHPQQVTVISGFPSSGKTVLAGQLLWDMAKEGLPSLMISLEMPADKILERIIPLASRRSGNAISDPIGYARANGADRPTKEQLEGIRKGINSIRDAPFEIVDPSNASIDQIQALIRRHVHRNQTRVVAVDYLQLIRGSKTLSREQQMSEISHAFQGIAKELNLSLILLSQQNKEGATKHAEAIAEDADTLLSILQDRNKESSSFGEHQGVMIRKDRHHGNTGIILPLYLNKEMIRFEERTHHP